MKIFNFMAVIAVAVMFTACDKEPQVKSTIVKNDYFSLSTDGTLKAKIAEYNADVKYVAYTNEGGFISDAIQVKSDGTFEIKLFTPSTFQGALNETSELGLGTTSFSNNNVKFEIIVFGCYADNELTDLIGVALDNYDSYIIYVDNDVDITGVSENGAKMDGIKLKKGWNVLIKIDGAYTTTLPKDFQLTFSDYRN